MKQFRSGIPKFSQEFNNRDVSIPPNHLHRIKLSKKWVSAKRKKSKSKNWIRKNQFLCGHFFDNVKIPNKLLKNETQTNKKRDLPE